MTVGLEMLFLVLSSLRFTPDEPIYTAGLMGVWRPGWPVIQAFPGLRRRLSFSIFREKTCGKQHIDTRMTLLSLAKPNNDDSAFACINFLRRYHSLIVDVAKINLKQSLSLTTIWNHNHPIPSSQTTPQPQTKLSTTDYNPYNRQ